MRQATVLVSGSRSAAFYSQIAALAAALRAITWQRWRLSLHAFLGGPETPAGDLDQRRWARFLEDVVLTHVSAESFAVKDNWAQVDASLDMAPGDSEAVILLDADTLPVSSFEDVLDRAACEDLVAGVMAHYPPPDVVSSDDWLRVANGLIGKALTFGHEYSLVERHGTLEPRAPFYVNGGVMLFGRGCFDRYVPRYLETRSLLAGRVADGYAGQVASTLAIADAGLRTWALPMRFNFPNDTEAERLHPEEAANVVIHHYLRTTRFDRHSIFATAKAFDDFMALPLDGPDRRFQTDVRRLFGSRYPFASF